MKEKLKIASKALELIEAQISDNLYQEIIVTVLSKAINEFAISKIGTEANNKAKEEVVKQLSEGEEDFDIKEDIDDIKEILNLWQEDYLEGFKFNLVNVYIGICNLMKFFSIKNNINI